MPSWNETRKVKLLKPKEHVNRNCYPVRKMYAAGDILEARWLHAWRVVDGMRGLGDMIEGVDFEFVA